MGRSLWLCAAAVLVVFACVAWEARAAVISIDFGGEWIKAALVKVSGWHAVLVLLLALLDICFTKFLFLFLSLNLFCASAGRSHGDCVEQVSSLLCSRVGASVTETVQSM